MKKQSEKVLPGNRFGRLTVLKRSDRRATRGARTVPLWECRCDCGTITYKATDQLKGESVRMCSACAPKYAAEKMRDAAGYVGGTQISHIKSDQKPSSSTSGIRGVYYDKNAKKWRARLKFRGKLMNFGSYAALEDAVKARREAEQAYFGAFLEQLEEKTK